MYRIIKNKYNFDINDIFVIGKRHNNPKRSFLFISKLLGKHLSVNPDVIRASGFLLSSLKYNFDNTEYIDCIKKGTVPSYKKFASCDDMLVIGFCETATGLGMAVASSIEGCVYQTTTREQILDMHKILTFEEAHSHATTHNMFSDSVELNQFDKVTLVDDEITTGNSLLNLMSQIEAVSHMKEYNIMAILDWRNSHQKELFKKFAEENNTTVNVYALIEGELEDVSVQIYQNENLPLIEKRDENRKLGIFERINIRTIDGYEDYITDSGRFGISEQRFALLEDNAKITAEKISKELNLPKGSKLLILGHGENIYIPSRVASYLNKDYDVKFKTTTLSPIYCDGNVIKDAINFFDRGRQYYFYNVCETKNYDKVIMLVDIGETVKICDNCVTYEL